MAGRTLSCNRGVWARLAVEKWLVFVHGTIAAAALENHLALNTLQPADPEGVLPLGNRTLSQPPAGAHALLQPRLLLAC